MAIHGDDDLSGIDLRLMHVLKGLKRGRHVYFFGKNFAVAKLPICGVTELIWDKGTIGIAMPTKSSARWIADGDNMVKVLKEKGYKADLQYAEDDIPNQLAQIENMVTKGVKVLVVASIDGTTLTALGGCPRRPRRARSSKRIALITAPPRMMREIQKNGWTSTGMPKIEKRIMCAVVKRRWRAAQGRDAGRAD